MTWQRRPGDEHRGPIRVKLDVAHRESSAQLESALALGLLGLLTGHGIEIWSEHEPEQQRTTYLARLPDGREIRLCRGQWRTAGSRMTFSIDRYDVAAQLTEGSPDARSNS